MSAETHVTLILTVGCPLAVLIGVWLGNVIGGGLHDLASDHMRIVEAAVEQRMRNEEIV